MNNKATVKFISLFLCVLMLALSVTSCKDETSSPVSEVSSGINETGRYTANIPEGTRFDTTVRILAPDSSNVYWARDIFAAENEPAIISEAIVERNNLLEEKLGVTIEPIWAAQYKLVDDYRTAVMGDTEFDLVYGRIEDLATIALEGDMLVDLSTVKSINFSDPWWDDNFNEEFKINNKLYYAAGEFTFCNLSGTMVTFFNKEIATNSGLPDLYQLARDGNWTWDKYGEFAKLATRELGGSSAKLEADIDQFGSVAEGFTIYEALISSDVRLFFKDENEKLDFKLDEQAIRVLNDCTSVLNDPTTGFVAQNLQGQYSDIWAVWGASFMEGRVLFNPNVVSLAMKYSSQAEFAYGVLPMPKYSSNQTDYRTTTTVQSIVFGMPITLGDERRETVGYIMQFMGAEGKNVLTPAYIETAVKWRGTSDEDAFNNIQLMLDNRVYDIGLMMDLGTSRTVLTNAFLANRGGWVSSFESIQNKIDTVLDEFNTAMGVAE